MRSELPEVFPSPLGLRPSANDAMKASAGRRFSVAAIGSVTAHLVVVLAVPSWTNQPVVRDNTADFLRLEPLIVVDEAFGVEDAGAGSLEFVVAPDPEAVGTDPAGVGDREFPGLAGLEDRIRGRLLGDPVAAALLVEPVEEEDEPSRGDSSAEDGPSLREIGSVASLPDWLTVPSSEMDRLSSVRPDIVVVAPSAWLLIRNPLEIDRFMRTSRDSGVLDTGFEGWVQVAIWIDERGSVDWAEVSRSSGVDSVDQLALALFEDVVSFRPAREGGVPVPVSVIFQLNFPFF